MTFLDMPREQIRALDAWRGVQEGVPSRAEAIRRLVTMTVEDKNEIIALCIKIDGVVDPESEDYCPLCGERLEAPYREYSLFLEGTWDVVCDTCAQKTDPQLWRTLDILNKIDNYAYETYKSSLSPWPPGPMSPTPRPPRVKFRPRVVPNGES